MSVFLSSCTDIFRNLESVKVRYCLLRDHLIPDAPLKDLDLLIHPQCLESAIIALKKQGFILCKTPKPRFKVVMSGFINGQVLSLDIHTRPVQNGLVFLDVDSVFRRIKRQGEYFVPSFEDQLILLLIHNIIGKHYITPKHLPVIKEIMERPIDWSAIRTSAGLFGFADILEHILHNIDVYSSPGAMSCDARATLRRRLWIRNWRGWPSLIWNKCSGLRWKLRIKRRGSLIAFIGPDGSGKTLLCEMLARRLSEVFGKEVPVQYMGPWGHYSLKIAERLCVIPLSDGSRDLNRLWSDVRRVSSGRKGATVPFKVRVGIVWKLLRMQPLTEWECSAARELKDHSVAYTIGKYVYYHLMIRISFAVLSIELGWRMLRVYAYLRLGQHVVADRFVYDLLTGSMHGVCNQLQFSGLVLCLCFPRPDACYYLWNEPKEIARRKSDLDEDGAALMLQAYEKIATRFRATKMKTDRPVNDLVEDIIKDSVVRMHSKMCS